MNIIMNSLFKVIKFFSDLLLGDTPDFYGSESFKDIDHTMETSQETDHILGPTDQQIPQNVVSTIDFTGSLDSINYAYTEYPMEHYNGTYTNIPIHPWNLDTEHNFSFNNLFEADLNRIIVNLHKERESLFKEGKELLECCNNRDLNKVEELLSEGADINIQDSRGYTPLHHASKRGHTEIVELLLKYKANPNIKNKCDFTPLHLASSGGYIDIVELLLKYKADPNIKNISGNIPLHYASMYGYTDITELIKEHMVELQITKEYTETRDEY